MNRNTSGLMIFILAMILLLPLLAPVSSSNQSPVKSGGNVLGSIERISVSSAATQANGTSEAPNISRNGRFITFHSTAANLVPNDINNSQDVFLYDRLTRTTQRVSIGIGNIEANNRSQYADLSSSGRYITFHSEATNLVPNDTNNAWDIFFRDMQTGQFERISNSSGGSQANGNSTFADISGDGRFITFFSEATNLTVNDTNGVNDVFIHDRMTGSTERISVSTGGIQGNGASTFPDISADGRYIVYESDATNLVANDSNGLGDIFLYDRINQTTERISLNSAEQEGNGRASYAVISANSQYVTYVSYASNIDPADPNPNGDIYLRNLVSGTTELISFSFNGQPTDGESHYPFLSSDGRLIVYHAGAANLVSGDTNNFDDIFLFDRQTGITRRINLSTTGVQGNERSHDPAISGNGRFIVFHSLATNLVPGDTNNSTDSFLYLDLLNRTYFPSYFR